MSYVNGTTHYNLPQTVGTDKRDWFDTNQAFADVDAALHTASETASAAASDITALSGRVGDLETASSSQAQDIVDIKADILTQSGAITRLDGDIDDVKADALDMICAIDEGTAQVATVAVTEGNYFRYNDVLYMATADIAVGDTIVPNTNCRATNVATELENLEGDSSLSTRVTTLEGKVEDLEANNFGSIVDLLSYDSFSNLYTIPADGYLRIDSGTGDGHASINVYGPNPTSAADPHISFSAQASNSGTTPVSMFVKKGMKCYRVNSGQTSPEYHFYPLS